MLEVPRRCQPDAFGCLPTCVWSVLTFQGYVLEYEEVEAACLVGPRGALLELAVQGLQEAGWDVEMAEELDLDTIRSAMEQERPIIASVIAGRIEGQPLAHAVVICDLTEDTLVVMDPRVGDYVSLPLKEFSDVFAGRYAGGFLIAGAAPL